MFLEARQMLGPTGCFIGAAVTLAASAYLLSAALVPRRRRNFRWGRGGKGPRMSAVGVTAIAIHLLAWCAEFAWQGIQRTPPPPLVFNTLMLTFFVLFGAAIRDVAFRPEG